MQSDVLKTFLTEHLGQALGTCGSQHQRRHPQFEKTWLKQAYYKLYQTTHAGTVFEYIRLLLVQNIQDLNPLILEDAKTFSNS